jgi:hypothetical protein
MPQSALWLLSPIPYSDTSVFTTVVLRYMSAHKMYDVYVNSI